MADSRYWSKELITNFIEIYKSYPCLWKVKSKEYTNKNLKNVAYKKLINICKSVNPEANRDYVVKKIQSFRGSFRKEVKKVFESKRSGAGEEDVYVPTLWYYDLLLFTSDQEIPTASISNMNTEEIEAEANEYGGEKNESERTENTGGNTQESVEQGNNETNSEDYLLTQKSYTPSERSSTTPKVKKRRMTDTSQDLNKFMNVYTEPLSQIDKIDEFDAVGINVAAKLRKMDPHQACLAEALLHKVLFKGIFKQLTLQTKLIEVPKNITYQQHPQSVQPPLSSTSSSEACDY